jgi:hypothetical protein
MIEITVHPRYTIDAGRYAKLGWTARSVDAAGNDVPLLFVSGDDVLWKIAASEGGASLLSLSKTPKAITGSKVTIDVLGSATDATIKPSGTVIIYPADTTLLASTKQVSLFDEVLLKDSGDGDALKTIVRGQVLVKPSQS